MGNWLNKSGLTQIRNILSDKFATKVDNHPSNVPEGKFLQTNENGYAVWGDAASPAAVAQAAEDWMDQHISGDLTLGLDSSLRLDGYAAESSAAGDIVMCTNTRPDPQDPTDHPSNKLWINNAQQTEYEIPEMSDLDDLKSAFNQSIPGNGNVFAGRNMVDLKIWLTEKGVSYTENEGAIVFTPTSTLFSSPYVFADVDIPVSAEFVATSTGGTYIQVLNSSDQIVTLPGNGCKVRMNWSSGRETTVTKFGIYYNTMSNEELTSNKADKTDINNLDQKIDSTFQNIADRIEFSLLNGYTPSEQTLLDQTTGDTTTNAGFFTYEDVDISGYFGGMLHVFSSAISNRYYARFCFFDENHEWISGFFTEETIGTPIPTDAKYLSICFAYINNRSSDGKPETYWASIISNNPTLTKLDEDVEYNRKSDIFMPYKGARKGIISIVIDGDFAFNSRIVRIADSYNLKLGFGAPFLTDRFVNNGLDLYLAWQAYGHEMAIHGLYNVGTGSPYTEEQIAEKIKEAYEEGLERGYDLHGYVAYQGNTVAFSREEIKKYFAYSFSMANHSGAQSAPNNEPCMYIGQQTPYTMFRYSMETSTLQQQKDAVDRAITTGGYLCLYGHTDNEGGNFTPENFEVLCAYIVDKVEDHLVDFDTPYRAMQKYFTPRYSDLYETMVDITSKIAVDQRFTVISNKVFFDTVHHICYVNMRIRANQAVSGNNIVFATGLPYSYTRYYVGTNKPTAGIFIVDDSVKSVDSISIANGEDVYISASYYTYRAYDY